MLYVDTPNDRELAALFAVKADACVSIYLRTTPITPDVGASKIEFSNLIREAVNQLEARGVPRARRADLQELLEDVLDDEIYWLYQANTLAVLATPDQIRTFRLANQIDSRVEVSDRFDIKPLLRATTFDHSAYVIALSENRVRLIEIFADLPPEEIQVPDQPRDLQTELGLDNRQKPQTRRPGSGDRGQTGGTARKLDLARYCRRIDAALAPALHGSDIPVIVMAAQPIASIFHNQCSAENLLPQIISHSPDRLTLGEIAAEARKVLEVHYRGKVEDFHEHYQRRLQSHRSSDNLEEVARAATFGSIETLYIDIDSKLQGTLDEQGGAVDYAPHEGVVAYSLVGEITRRALASGAKVIALRKGDMPGASEVAATLRFAI
jgi:hypothetical protein